MNAKRKQDDERRPLPLDGDRLAAAGDAEEVRVRNLLLRNAIEAIAEGERVAMGSFLRPDGPAVFAEDMVQDQVYSEVTDGGSVVTSAKLATRRRSPLAAAFEKGQLEGGLCRCNPRVGGECRCALDRYEAGKTYERLFSASQTAGRDSTQAMNVSGSGYSGSISEAVSDALRALGGIHSHLDTRNRKIVMMVCGYGYKPVEAIRAVCGTDYADTISARFREALDALIDAMGARKCFP